MLLVKRGSPAQSEKNKLVKGEHELKDPKSIGYRGIAGIAPRKNIKNWPSTQETS